jgi:hypothetical protein
MARAKKLRRDFYNGKINVSSLTEHDKKYLHKHVRRLKTELTGGSSIPTYKEVPCQKLTGKKVLVPEETKILEGTDGLLYIEEEKPENLVISLEWRRQVEIERIANSIKEKQQKEKDVTQLKPTQLGE